MTTSFSFLFLGLLAAVAGLAAVIYLAVSARRSRSPMPLSPTGERPPRSALWALLLIATVPLAFYATLMGGTLMAMFLGRCNLWSCVPNATLADLDLSAGTLGMSALVAALIFGIWWLALLPSPLPRSRTPRRALQLGIAAVATLVAVAHAFFGFL